LVCCLLSDTIGTKKCTMGTTSAKSGFFGELFNLYIH